MGGHERLDHRQHRGGLGLVALERVDHQREPGRVGQQADGDLGLQATFLGGPGLAEPVTGVGLEVQGCHVIEQQGRRSQADMVGAQRRQPLSPRIGGVRRQAPLEGPVGHRRDASLGEHPQRVQLAGRLDDPRQHQLPEDLVSVGRVGEPQRVVDAAQGIPQVPHPRGCDRQRTTRPRRCVQPEVELALPGRQPLTGHGLEQLELDIVMGRPDVLDVP